MRSGFGRGLVLSALLALGLVLSAGAKAVTLGEIAQRGSVRIGVLTGVPPMGMVDENGQPAGYDIDVANTLGRYLGVAVELVPLTPPSRIPALQTGQVDFLVATLAPTAERSRSVMFTIPYNAFTMVIMSTETEFDELSDLAGQRVGVNRGSSQETALRNANLEGTEVVVYEDDATVVQALMAGQIDAAAVPSTLAKAVLDQAPDSGLRIAFPYFQQANSMTTRLGEYEIHQWLNTAIYIMKNSGELDAIARRWTGEPLATLPVF